MSGAGGAGVTEVTTWVTLELDKKPVGTAKIRGVTLSADVDDVRALVKEVFSDDLVGIGRAHIQLFCKSELGRKGDPSRQHVVGGVLTETNSLVSEVELHLKTFPATLYLLAVAEGA